MTSKKATADYTADHLSNTSVASLSLHSTELKSTPPDPPYPLN